MARSPQMQALMTRYGVTTKTALLHAIRDEYTRETCDPGDPPYTLAMADVILDRMLEAEYQRIAGGAYDEATSAAAERLCQLCGKPVRGWDELPGPGDPIHASCADEYERNRDPRDRYGTPEHEAWLLEREQEEG